MELTDKQKAELDAKLAYLEQRDAAQAEAEDDMELPFAPDYDYADMDYFAADDEADADSETYLVTITAPKGGRRLTVTLDVDRY